MRACLLSLALTAIIIPTAACTETATECTSSPDCRMGGRCVDGTCQIGVDGSPADSAVDSATPDTSRPADASPDTTEADTSVTDTGVADTAVTDTAVADSAVVDTGPVDTGVPECSLGEYRTCPGPGGQYCRPSRMWSVCQVADPTCTGSGGSYMGCRGTGCSVCTDLLAGYDCYFENHPTCVPNPTCGGLYFTCSPGCPAPSAADVCP